MLISIILGLLVVFLLAWNYYLIKRLTYMSTSMIAVLEVLTEFHTHLTHVSNLDLYYGDETLKGLITNLNITREYLQHFNGQWSLDETENDVDEETENNVVEEVAEIQPVEIIGKIYGTRN